MYISRVVTYSYEKEFEIWLDLGWPAVKIFLEGCLHLILSPSPFEKIQIVGTNYKLPSQHNCKIWSTNPRTDTFLGLLSFHFQILHTKLDISVFNHFFIYCFVISTC